MMDASQRQSIRQRRQNMFLTDNISKSLGTPFSRKYLIAHVDSTKLDGKMSADALQPLYKIAVVYQLRFWLALVILTPKA